MRLTEIFESLDSHVQEERRGSNQRIERILRQLRARYPEAGDDLEALILNFRSEQSRDRADISRLDAENDQEEIEIDQLERELDRIKKNRGLGERMGIRGLGEQTCPECGGPAFTDLVLAEKKDACYHKVRSRYKVWPSAYASGALVQCRKKGAKNWGTKS